MKFTTQKLTTFFVLFFIVFAASSQGLKTEEDYYRIETVPIPEGIEMEIGGMAVLPDGRLATTTRRGDVWLIGNPYMLGNTLPTFHKFAEGLHEPLGLNFIDSKLWVTQRGEVTILEDQDNDEEADVFQSFYKWPLSGNYHQYSYGPVLMKDGRKLFTLNLDWIGHGSSGSKWRGWMIAVDDEGNMEPWAAGLRSPAGYMVNDVGDIFYTENQGDWVGSGRMTHLEKGDFAGNPESLIWSGEPNSPVKLTPDDIPDTGKPLFDEAQKVAGIKPPAVWFPHTLMGISTSDIVQDMSKGKFGPFEGQYFVGDQGHSVVMRVAMEKVNGVYQGACFPFREGFKSGILRMRWGLDNSMFVGMTSRGWSSTGKSKFGLQRLVWSGEMPFEIASIKSASDGFLVNFTKPIMKSTALNPASYDIKSFNYKYHHNYGSPIINQRDVKIEGISLSEDGKSVHLAVDSMRLGYIFGITAAGIMDVQKDELLHNVGYFTLNSVNSGVKSLDLSAYAITKKMDHAQHQMTEVPAIISAKRVNKMPSSWNGEADVTITLGTKPGLKFDQSELQVKVGSKVKLVFNNNDDMLHNLVIVKPNSVDKVGQSAQNMGLDGAELGYIPDLAEVMYHTGLMQPESTEAIYFTAPQKKGDYTFVCTFPGHYTLMQGTMTVR
ncbi:MAG: azurin/glucose/arabinose dehydrogenase [Algoriphagus sp.]|jgi:azurin/glucose/arabinose dehydrogenase